MKKYRDLLLSILLLLPATAFAGNSELSKDIKSIISSSPIIKDELETTKEFNGRVKKLYEKYSNKSYKVSFKVNDKLYSSHKYLKYNADTSTLTISLPRLNKKLMWVESNGDRNIKFLNFSYIQTEPSKTKKSKYTARNGLGNEVTVTKVIEKSSGIAILGRSNRDMIPQHFSANISRDKVRGILKKGKIILNVKTDLQNLEKEPSIFLTDKDENTPTMQTPIHVIQEKNMLPVRLLSIELYDSKGNRIIKEKGKEIDTKALDD